VVGDFNIAPEDRDVHNPAAWAGQVLCSPPERAALAALRELGFADTFRLFEQPPATFSWWDYRGPAFRRNQGLRIDLMLASGPLSKICVGCRIDKEPRGWERPSDHVPVVAEFAAP
jgi:exodeoxyribonuclease III